MRQLYWALSSLALGILAVISLVEGAGDAETFGFLICSLICLAAGSIIATIEGDR